MQFRLQSSHACIRVRAGGGLRSSAPAAGVRIPLRAPQRRVQPLGTSGSYLTVSLPTMPAWRCPGTSQKYV